jgi:hypothetical protein
MEEKKEEVKVRYSERGESACNESGVKKFYNTVTIGT